MLPTRTSPGPPSDPAVTSASALACSVDRSSAASSSSSSKLMIAGRSPTPGATPLRPCAPSNHRPCWMPPPGAGRRRWLAPVSPSADNGLAMRECPVDALALGGPQSRYSWLSTTGSIGGSDNLGSGRAAMGHTRHTRRRQARTASPRACSKIQRQSSRILPLHGSSAVRQCMACLNLCVGASYLPRLLTCWEEADEGEGEEGG